MLDNGDLGVDSILSTIIDRVVIVIFSDIPLTVSDNFELDKAVPETLSDGVNVAFICVTFFDAIVVTIFVIVELTLLDALAGVGEIESSPLFDVRVVDDGIPLIGEEDVVIGDSDIVTEFMGLIVAVPIATVLDIVLTFNGPVVMLKVGCVTEVDIVELDLRDETDVTPKELANPFMSWLMLFTDSVGALEVVSEYSGVVYRTVLEGSMVGFILESRA